MYHKTVLKNKTKQCKYVLVWSGSEPLETTMIPTITNIHIEFPASKVCRMGVAPEASHGLQDGLRPELSFGSPQDRKGHTIWLAPGKGLCHKGTEPLWGHYPIRVQVTWG